MREIQKVHPAIANNASRQVDVRCVFDTTGSMSNKIGSLVESMALIVDSLGRLQLNWQFSVVPFGDLTVPGDRVVTDLPPTREIQSAQRLLRSLPRFSGGANLGESSGEAMLSALNRPFRPNAVKIVVLITDEPALGADSVSSRVDRTLGAVEAMCFTIAPDAPYFRHWAERHGGTWQRIGPTIDGRALVQTFEAVMQAAVRIADTVHVDHGGSVGRYLKRASLPGAAEAMPRRHLTRASTAPPLRPPTARPLTRADAPPEIPPGRWLGPGR